MRIFYLSLFWALPLCTFSQNGYGNQWIFGRFSSPNPSGTILNFNGDSLIVEPLDKPMELESTCAIMSDSMGKLLFYSNGCYIANASHQMMTNSDSLAHGLLESSFCNSGGNPLTQGMIALPKGKIYIAGIFHDHLHVINRPNCLGVSCDLEQYAIQMYWINSYTMPNTPQYKRWSESDTCVAVGTNEVISGDDITIFPNPVTEIINLKTETQFDNLRIFDITGRVISTFNQIPLEGKTSIDVHQLPPGLYFLQLQAGNKVWSKKFVKL